MQSLLSPGGFSGAVIISQERCCVIRYLAAFVYRKYSHFLLFNEVANEIVIAKTCSDVHLISNIDMNVDSKIPLVLSE